MRIIDADKLIEDIEGIDWYSTNRCGVLHEGAIDKHEAYYRAYDIISAIQNAPTVELSEAMVALKNDRDHLLRIAGNMHEWIFRNSYDEAEAYKECGLSDEDNARLGYGGSVLVELRGDDE